MKKIINYILIFIMLGFDFFYIINCVKFSNYDRVHTYLALPIVLLVPYLLEKILKKELDSNLKIIYFSFIFFADFLGCVVNLYGKIAWFDTFTHYLSGIFTAYLGILLMNKFQIKQNFLGRIIYVLSFTCLIAVMWEFFEYGMDSLFGMTLQHADTTGVNDTMIDLIAAFLGSITFLLFYRNNNEYLT